MKPDLAIDALSLVPGPSPVHPEVLEYLAKPPLDHRTLDYGTQLGEINEMLYSLLGTDHADIFVLPASGTLALEATLRNLVSDPLARVVVPVNGHMGERLAKLAGSVSQSVYRVLSPWGESFSWDLLTEEISPGSVVAAVHHETSTGFSNDIARLGTICKKRDALLMVDAISSAGVMPIDMDRSCVDALIATSQKGVGSVAGLSIVAVGPRAWKEYLKSAPPSFAWDWANMRKEYQRSPRRSPWTPAANLMAALHCSLSRFIQAGGMEHAAKTTSQNTLALHRDLKNLGFRVLPWGDQSPGPVTAAYPPGGVTAAQLCDRLAREHRITISGGQGLLRDEIIRIAFFGQRLPESRSRLKRALEKIYDFEPL